MTSSFRQVNLKYLMNAPHDGNSKIKIRSPIIKTAEGNYSVFGKEFHADGREREINAVLSETSFNELKRKSSAVRNPGGNEQWQS